MTVLPLPRIERDPARRATVAALFALTAAAAHVPATPHHVQEMPYVGVGFIGVTLACLVGATGIVLHNALWAWAISGATCFASIAAWVVSRTVGLPGMDGHDVGNWGEPLALMAVVSEVLVVAFAASVVGRCRESTRPRSRRRERGQVVE